MSENQLFTGKIREFEKTIVAFFAEMRTKPGQTPNYDIIAAYLLIHTSLTQSQLKELTGFSLGSISNILTTLTNMGYVEKRLIKGSHTAAYSLGPDFEKSTLKMSELKREKNEAAAQFLQEKLQELNENNDPTKKGYSLLTERINGLLNFLQIHNRLIEKVPAIIQSITPKEAAKQ